ncbi:MAG: hypothetical protein AAGI36_17070 [Pseudomonadota bacterium]
MSATRGSIWIIVSWGLRAEARKTKARTAGVKRFVAEISYDMSTWPLNTPNEQQWEAISLFVSVRTEIRAPKEPKGSRKTACISLPSAYNRTLRGYTGGPEPEAALSIEGS